MFGGVVYKGDQMYIKRRPKETKLFASKSIPIFEVFVKKHIAFRANDESVKLRLGGPLRFATGAKGKLQLRNEGNGLRCSGLDLGYVLLSEVGPRLMKGEQNEERLQRL